MTTIERLAPAPGWLELDATIAALTAPGPEPLRPFDPRLLAFFSAFSQILFAHPEGRHYPDLVALAFWMRRAELARLQRAFEALATPEVLLAPRGLVFHIPPANVDTMFVYSWLLAAITGNRNVVRISERNESPQVQWLCETLNQLLARPEHAAIAAANAFLRYGHEEAVNARLSAACDVRVIWGGDATIERLRTFPLGAHARELVFPDRYSLAVLDAAAVLALSAAEMAGLAEGFYNDVYWFDQQGCASPRLVVWRGEEAAQQQASRRFFEQLADHVAQRRYRLTPAVRMSKWVETLSGLLDAPVQAYHAPAPEVAVLRVTGLPDLRERWCGGGLFYETRIETLTELVPFVCRKDQTLIHHGVSHDDLVALAQALNGRGIDRMVPVGQALAFDRVWDGQDLLSEFVRRVAVRA
ncbi:MAG: acyl-CoA reductase [Candidatus Sericytochromatia bacterium]|nr:acyl-CoA reductase [Candidatus Sericytochromatia bacterium]